MKRNLIPATVFVIFLAFMRADLASAQRSHSNQDGLSVNELRNFAKSLSPSLGRIEEFRFFRPAAGGGVVNGIALLTSNKESGWQILVFDHEADGKFSLEWKSGKLDDSFRVSQGEALKVIHIGSEKVVEFSGCAPHNCPEVFSVMFYVSSKRTSFTATYLWGKVSYSPAYEISRNAAYKSTLDQLIADLRSPDN